MPRTRRSHLAPAVATASDPPGPALAARPSAAATPPDYPLPPKRRTVASNALAIDSMGAQLHTMSQLLEKISGKVCADGPLVPGLPQPAASASAPTPAHLFATPARAPAPVHSPAVPTIPPTLHTPLHPPGFPALQTTPLPGHQSAWLYQPQHKANPGPSNTDAQLFANANNCYFPLSQAAAQQHGQFQPAPAHTTYHARSDPLGAAAAPRRHFDLPASLQDLGENPDIDATVTHLLSHTLAPLVAANGRKLHAHSFVKRGLKKSNTNLGELTIAEYNTGFMRLMNNSRTAQADKLNMFKHLGQLNEDAILYEWRGVCKWSEEVCAMVRRASCLGMTSIPWI